jgi:MoaA/NifB/PqqE/SkfB family radical SAM enzyme
MHDENRRRPSRVASAFSRVPVGKPGRLLVRSAAEALAFGPTRRMALRGVDLLTRAFVRARPGWSSDPRRRFESEAFARAVVDTLGRQLTDGSLSTDFVRRAGPLWVRGLTGDDGAEARAAFNARMGVDPPHVLTIAPTGACNLSCQGCYASSATGLASMPYAELERLVDEARRLWGIRLVVFTGGEPFLYESRSKGVLDIAEANPDLLFLIFTNGILVDLAVARRLVSLGNVTVALSVDGLRETTDARRGAGTFDGVVRGLEAMREAGAWAGISVTVTRGNCEEVYSDEFLDLFFEDNSAFYAFVFQYMPEGRDPDPSLMPTPEQRIWMWERSWEVIADRRIVLFDFWNHASLVGGCLSAGRERGYLYVDWDGNVMPCVFAPYSSCNINELRAVGGSLNDAWASPFLCDIRDWQRSRSSSGGPVVCAGAGGNLMCACPVRDHYADFREMVLRNGARPIGPTTGTCLSSADYTQPMIQ